MARLSNLAMGAVFATALSGCTTALAPPADTVRPVTTALSDPAPDAMRWLYASGEAAGVSIQTWRMIGDYAGRVAASPPPAASVPMGLPGRASGTGTVGCRRADGSAKPLAMVFDVDETVILNEGFEYHLATGHPYDRAEWEAWERTGADSVSPVPGAVTGIRRLRDAGVTPIFNTNRQYSPEGAAQAIATAGLGEVVHRETLFLRGDDGSTSGGKDGRRALIAERFCVIGLAGDNLGDFADIFNAEGRSVGERRDLSARGDYARLWGNGWFALPNPVYGDSIKGTIEEVFPAARRWSPAIVPSDAPAIMNEGQ
ncbi:5'-nucleotidase, lipoprotein e(P4) family [Qipengyuania spongiae]|uniref:Acid phosphatase n=1 Tax=Qipengyuania spongiae TaxID=2909673 RepID=A0ABY5SYW5_9SPHN|nr:HAD family acid phosphatase [Qipengyuania spongiae]UVI39732.1 acid phosphatase [Qipengyuania spongiae]